MQGNARINLDTKKFSLHKSQASQPDEKFARRMELIAARECLRKSQFSEAFKILGRGLVTSKYRKFWISDIRYLRKVINDCIAEERAIGKDRPRFRNGIYCDTFLNLCDSIIEASKEYEYHNLAAGALLGPTVLLLAATIGSWFYAALGISCAVCDPFGFCAVSALVAIPLLNIFCFELLQATSDCVLVRRADKFERSEKEKEKGSKLNSSNSTNNGSPCNVKVMVTPIFADGSINDPGYGD